MDYYDLEIYIDHNDKPKGIGGGMNFCVDKVKTEFVNIIHADMGCAPNQDLELLKLYARESCRCNCRSKCIQSIKYTTDSP